MSFPSAELKTFCQEFLICKEFRISCQQCVNRRTCSIDLLLDPSKPASSCVGKELPVVYLQRVRSFTSAKNKRLNLICYGLGASLWQRMSMTHVNDGPHNLLSNAPPRPIAKPKQVVFGNPPETNHTGKSIPAASYKHEN